MRTWTKLLPTVLLVLPFTWSSVRADAEANAKNIEQLQKDVKQLRKDVQELQSDMVKYGLRGARIEEQLDKILRRLDRVAQQQQTIERIAGYGPPLLPGSAVPLASGTVILQNQYSSPAQVRINGQSYTVAPFQTIQVPRVPTGTFEYSVEVDGLMIKPPHMETLPSKGYRITIYQP